MSNTKSNVGVRVGKATLKSAGKHSDFSRADYELVSYGYAFGYLFLLMMAVPMTLAALNMQVASFWVAVIASIALAITGVKAYRAFSLVFVEHATKGD